MLTGLTNFRTISRIEALGDELKKQLGIERSSRITMAMDIGARIAKAKETGELHTDLARFMKELV